MKTGVNKTNSKRVKSIANNRTNGYSGTYNYNNRNSYRYTKRNSNYEPSATSNKAKGTKKRVKNNSKNKENDMLWNYTKVTLVGSSKEKKICAVGISWSNLFFPFIYPLLKGDFLNLIVQTILWVILSEKPIDLKIIVWIVYSIFYNKIYISILLAKGYKPFSKSDRKILKEKGII